MQTHRENIPQGKKETGQTASCHMAYELLKSLLQWLLMINALFETSNMLQILLENHIDKKTIRACNSPGKNPMYITRMSPLKKSIFSSEPIVNNQPCFKAHIWRTKLASTQPPLAGHSKSKFIQHIICTLKYDLLKNICALNYGEVYSVWIRAFDLAAGNGQLPR